MPENTIPAMKNAIDPGMTKLELDTHITVDGQVVVGIGALLIVLKFI